MEQRKTSELIWREDLYPRFEPNPTVIQQYAESIDHLPPVEINQHNELIDGYHRWVAHKKADIETIAVTVTETASDNEFLRLAIQRNAKHGLQLSNAEKKSFVLKLYTGDTTEKPELADLFSVSKRTIGRWTADRDKALKEERDRRIAEMWLACHTEEEIAEAVGCSVQPVKDVIREPDKNDTWRKNLILSRYQEPDWSPPLYSEWKYAKKTNQVSHFGNSEQRILDNLLYLYTEPFDIIVDPFGGGGATIDVCKRRLRRYWVSDRKPAEERAHDMRTWDILEGPPPLYNRWSDVTLTFLDPPYWWQAKGEYSDDPEDLANMALQDFTEKLASFIREIAKRQSRGAIAMLMQGTQWRAPKRRYIDHLHDIRNAVGDDKLYVAYRISCPYSSEQSNAQQVDWAKANKEVLVNTRELLVWRFEDGD